MTYLVGITSRAPCSGLATKFVQDQNENISKKDPGACHKSDAHHFEKNGGLLSEDSQGDRFISTWKIVQYLEAFVTIFRLNLGHFTVYIYIYTLNIDPDPVSSK